MSRNMTGRPLLRDEVRLRIIKMISDEKMKSGERLLPEKELGKFFGVNHLTVRAAYAELVESNIVCKIPGKGTFFKGFPRERLIAGNSLAGLIMLEEEHFFNLVRNQIVSELQDAGFFCRCSSCSPNDDPSSMISQIQAMIDNNVNHLLIIQTELEKSPETIKFLNASAHNFKSIIRLFGNQSSTAKIAGSNFSADYAGTFASAIERFKAAGLRRIAYLCANCAAGHPAASANRKFAAMYSEAMINAQLGEFISVRSCDININGDAVIKELLSSDNPPEAVIGTNDYFAARVLEIAHSLGLKIPADLSLIGRFDTPWSQHFDMASFRFPIKEFSLAVKNAVISGENGLVSLFPMELVERNSIKEIK